MNKKLKVTAIIFAVVFCTLLGCQRKEKESDELLLLQEESEQNQSAGTGSRQAEDEQAQGDFERVGEDANPQGQTASEDLVQSVQADAVPAGQSVRPNAGAGTAAGESEPENEIFVVHVCGAVREPGVYRMRSDSRIYQAIEKAGGFEQNADENYLNQADLLSDGMKIYVPTKEEVEASGGEIEWKTAGGGSTGADMQSEAAAAGAFPVNINTAGEAQLTTLPGVGSSKAKSIIAYREQNGNYRKIEDIMNVEGIKDGVFQKIKDIITV